MEIVPVKRRCVRSHERGEDVFLYDVEAGRVFAVNKTASLVWELIDGESSVTDIARQVRNRYDPTARDVALDVAEIVSDYGRYSLVTTRTR